MNQEKQPSPELFLNAVMAYRDSAAVKGAVDLDVALENAQEAGLGYQALHTR